MNLDYQGARQAGYSDEEIRSYAKANNLQVQGLPQEQPSQSNGFVDYLPLIGAVGGSFISPVVGSAAGAALGTAAKQAITGKADIGEIAKEGALGAAGGVVGKGIGAVGRAVLPKITGKATEGLALRGVRATASQQRKFTQKTGKDLTDFVLKKKLFHGGTQQVDELIQPLQQQYDDLAISSGKDIPVSKLIQSFKGRISELKKTPTTQAQTLAESLVTEMNLVKKQFGNKSVIPIGQLTKLRRDIDQLIPASKFTQDPLMAGKNKMVRDIYKQTIDETTGGATKTIGNDLRDLYAFRDIAELQQGLGRGTLPVGLMQLMPAIAGGGIGYGGTGDAKGALVGALGAAGFTHIANHPKSIELLTKALQKTGSATLPPITSNVVGQSAVRLPSIVSSGEGLPVSGSDVVSPSVSGIESNAYQNQSYNTAQNNQPPLSGELPPITSMDSTIYDKESQQQYLTGYSPQELYQGYQQAIMSGDKATAAVLKGWFDDEQKYQESQGGTMLSLSDSAVKNVTDLQAGLRDIQNLGQSLQSSGAVGPIAGFRNINPYDVEARSLQAEIDRVRQVVGKALEGGVLRKEDEEKYKKILPTVHDTKEVAQNKLIQLQEKINSDLQNYINFQQQYGKGAGQYSASTLPPIQ